MKTINTSMMKNVNIEEIEVIGKIGDFDNFRVHYETTLCLLKHNKYECPFCSHGETIYLKEINVPTMGNLEAGFRKIYLECDKHCFSYGIVEDSYTGASKIMSKVYELTNEEIINQAKLVFSTLINKIINLQNIDYIQ